MKILFHGIAQSANRFERSRLIMVACATLILVALTGCGTFIEEMPKHPLAHGVHGKSGEFLFAVQPGTNVSTLARIHEINPEDFTEESAAKLIQKYGGERFLFFGTDSALDISATPGLDWFAEIVEENLKTAGYQPKRVPKVGPETKAGMQITVQEFNPTSFVSGLDTVFGAHVVLKVSLIKDGHEIKSAVIEGKGQQGMTFVFANAYKLIADQASNAFYDALMQTFRLLRDADL